MRRSPQQAVTSVDVDAPGNDELDQSASKVGLGSASDGMIDRARHLIAEIALELASANIDRETFKTGHKVLDAPTNGWLSWRSCADYAGFVSLRKTGEQGCFFTNTGVWR